MVPWLRYITIKREYTEPYMSGAQHSSPLTNELQHGNHLQQKPKTNNFLYGILSPIIDQF